MYSVLNYLISAIASMSDVANACKRHFDLLSEVDVLSDVKKIKMLQIITVLQFLLSLNHIVII